MRSGSTLLDRVLSRVPGFVSVGEIVHLWDRGVRRNELCGCGVPFLECPFWTRVGSLAFGGWDALDVDAVIELQRSVDRTRYIPMMLVARGHGPYGRRLRRYTSLLFRLYQGIDAASNGSVIVDSSKRASTAFVLRRVVGVRLLVVHLVRDSRGVAFSLMKRVQRPEVTTAVTYMPKAAPARSALEWMAVNGLFHALRPFGTQTTLVKYESLVGSVRGCIQQIVEALGKGSEPGQLDFINEGVVELALDHTVSGNPMRFAVGDVDLRLDEEWMQNMARADRLVTTVLTWPLLLKYGYVAPNRR